MDETPAADGTTIVDSSGSGNTGTWNTNDANSSVAGRFGNALQFDDDLNDYVIANPVGAWPTTEFTLSTWVNTTTTGTESILSYFVPGSNNEFLLSRPDALRLWIGTVPIDTTISIADGNWHHLAITWASGGGALEFFVDGESQFTGTLAAGHSLVPGGSFVIGQDQDTAGGGFQLGQGFDGQIDETGVYSRVLTSVEVATLARNVVAAGTGNINVTASDVALGGSLATTGSGSTSLTTTSNILMDTPGWSITTVDGDITLSANQQAVQTSGDFYGVLATGGTIAAAGTGNITINGRGSIGGISRPGVAIDPNTTVSTNTGDVTIVGVGATNVGAQNNGVQVHQGSVVESTGGGSIDITGTAGTEGYGVRVLYDGQVRTTGTGAITLTGTGGAGTASGAFINYGVGIDLGTTGNGTAVSNSGSGTITINATAGSGTPAFFMGRGGTNRLGFDGTNAYAGDIVINADTMDISDAIIQSSGDLFLQPMTPGTSIGLGGGAGTLNLTQAELDALADGFNSITINGDLDSTISEDFSTAGIPATLEANGATGNITDNLGDLRFGGVGNASRSYVRTIAAQTISAVILLRKSPSLSRRPAPNSVLAFFGMGEGTPDPAAVMNRSIPAFTLVCTTT